MSETVVTVSGLGKRYASNAAAPARSVWAKLFGPKAPEPPEFWALRDVSFEVKRGEVLGIMGRNGSGKSTLLKILSRVTDPTEGRAEVVGRLGALLEVSTGFHPELTGRENIRLRAAVLGMSQAELDAKFDDIVEFSEIGEFLDTQVKHYSSGMYTRLAFSVSSQLEPDVLILDEVLAVGDASFQEKCKARMEQLRQGGRTVILVSHNVEHISQSAGRVVVLDRGRVRFDGPVSEGVAEYLRTAGKGARAALVDQTVLKVRSQAVEVLPAGRATAESRLRITVEFDRLREVADPVLAVVVTTFGGMRYCGAVRRFAPGELPASGKLTIETEAIRVAAGTCFVNMMVYDGDTVCQLMRSVGLFEVANEGQPLPPNLLKSAMGSLVPARWEVTR